MNDQEKEIYQWVQDVKRIWNEQGSLIEAQVGYGKIKPFMNSLITLSNELQFPQSRSSDQDRQVYLSELAHEVYDNWIDLEQVRAEVGASLDPVPIGGHKLPPLPYAYNDLEPYISEEIMRLHHSKHHQSYVDGLNKAEEEMQKARKKRDYDLIKHWEREAAFHGAGHYLHTIFWNIMSPRGGGQPSGELAAQINKDFGSFNKMKEHFSKAAEKVEAVGWALLVWSPRTHRLEILQAEKHQNLSQQDVIPLLVLDVWEHAYYLQYKNEREPYINNWWNLVHWPEVEKRYLQARNVRWETFK
ncbi:superoxide dismutase [Halalkalibacter krulwichiae]|uniref:superoxide dismutase n=1 Tax=Halalkalibacter krulwichiae TaxID=199441 RepID=A0A1X9M9Z8_9BACI|nr:superoxide dismutase [Halalkalibacter krulwichiae]ARK30227.1 Superoxide dismutase, Mn/Fe [Halalkalibacter krulwichiae]